MHHLINPLVDCVFKAILGDPAHKQVLLGFLNAIMAPQTPILDVEILNPYSPAEFVGDDLRVVDIRARDGDGAEIEIEVQLQVRPWMSTRVLYQWADLYQSQLQRGESFRNLRPLTAIWVLAQDLLPHSPGWHHHFRLIDPRDGTQLSDHLHIHTLELHKWSPPSGTFTSEDIWANFLKEGHGWRELPASLRTPELEMAMRVLERFSEKAEDYHRYQARMNFLREQAALSEERQQIAEELAATNEKLEASRQTLSEKELALSETTQALSETTQALSETTQALSEKELALSETTQALSEKELALSEKELALSETTQALSEKDQALSEKDQALSEKDRAIAALAARLRALGVEP